MTKVLPYSNSKLSFPSQDCEIDHIRSYPKINTWKEDVDCCLWDGVGCDNITGQVIGLDLRCSWLSGALHSNSSPFLLLSHLQRLDISHNDFKESKISSKFGRFTSLMHLDLSCSWFSSTVPYEISYLSKLFILDLSSCDPPAVQELILKHEKSNLSGIVQNLTETNLPSKDIEFPDNHSNFIQCEQRILPGNIRFRSISNNNLTGEISDICNLKFLETLDLSHNNFSGIIPQCVGSFSQSLSSLNLKMNMFHGIIPPTFAKGCGLQNLNLNGNRLEGPLPRSISNCKDLEALDLGRNKINDAFPDWLEALSELQVLVLHSNNFQGPIGTSRNHRSLPKLRVIDLSYNNFSGPLPTSYITKFRGMINLDKGKVGRYMKTKNYSYEYSVDLFVKGLEIEMVKILTTFASIDLSNNNFEGEIPTTLGELTSLRGLNLSHNNLVGHIPSSLGNMTLLEWLDLSSNKLGGQIPRGLVDLTFLSFFNVSYNQLVGPIPQGKQFNTFENSSYEGNEGLCGLPLSRGCSSNEPQQSPPWMDSHEEDDSKLQFGWKIVAIGYGYGFIFGVAMGFVALRMGKPKWLVTLIG